jgi:hypothetical protein
MEHLRHHEHLLDCEHLQDYRRTITGSIGRSAHCRSTDGSAAVTLAA